MLFTHPNEWWLRVIPNLIGKIIGNAVAIYDPKFKQNIEGITLQKVNKFLKEMQRRTDMKSGKVELLFSGKKRQQAESRWVRGPSSLFQDCWTRWGGASIERQLLALFLSININFDHYKSWNKNCDSILFHGWCIDSMAEYINFGMKFTRNESV